MEVYTVTVATGTAAYSGTNNYVYLTLLGEHGESERTLLDNPGLDFCRGAVDEYKVASPSPLGSVLVVRLEKQKYWVEDNWFCRYVKVEPPAGASELIFPCYQWLIGEAKVEIREGTGMSQWEEDPGHVVVNIVIRLAGESLGILLEELEEVFRERECPCSDCCSRGLAKTVNNDNALLQAHRKAELQERQKNYRWTTWAQGIPRCIDAETEADLHPDVRFDNEKKSDFQHSLQYALLELCLKKFVIMFGKSWNNLEDFKGIFWKLRSPIAEYCMEHWKEDRFFGYQCMNGSNPRMIARCRELPSKFPITPDMVQSSMYSRTDLANELKAGNIYILDYAIMDGIPANTIKGVPQHIAAPICLLYNHPDEGLKPIAIQLEQTPGVDTPIFLPTDPPLAWLLAKMWVRHAEFQVFQLLSHLLRTHLVMEVFCVATLRQLPAVHPIYKLLTPHLRYTLEINCRGRTQLISPDGIFKQVVSTGGNGMLVLAQREYSTLTYRSLHPRNDFADRGVHQLPRYFYREHSLMLWETIRNFVSGVVSAYYQSDQDVQQDSELQAWIRDITEEGFAELPGFGLPLKLQTREELCTLLSVVIFTGTAQHAATNNGQFDWCAWIPNTPCTMRQPPPKDKDAVTMETIMATLPDISQSCMQMAITWHLGRAQPDAVSLGHYSEEYFTETKTVELISKFKEELREIEEHILQENEGVEPPYLFLLPSRIENSITI